MLNWIKNLWAPALDGGEERVVIHYNAALKFEQLDRYQKAHLRRYQFALDYVKPEEAWGDFACGTGYGSAMLADKTQKVIGADRDQRVIKYIRKRYQHFSNLQLEQKQLQELDYQNLFDGIVSFETIEHFTQEDIQVVLGNFHRALKPNGKLIFSTPYLQEMSPHELKKGFHLTFEIDENMILTWFKNNGFHLSTFWYQNYQDYEVKQTMETKDFILGIAHKID